MLSLEFGDKNMMNIAGVLLHALPAHTEWLVERLKAFSGVEVHAVESGKLVLTVEHQDPKQMAETITELSRLKYVMTAATVYEYSDKEGAEG